MTKLHRSISHRRFAGTFILCAALAAGSAAAPAAEVEAIDVGLTSELALIGGMRVAAGHDAAARVVLLGGLAGTDTSSRAIDAAVHTYAGRADADRPFELIAIPAANPDATALAFPPTGPAYRENAESHVIWRWLGLNAPDLVLIVGNDPAALTSKLENEVVAGVASIPARRVDAGASLLAAVPAEIAPSPARLEIERRRSRAPLEFARQLAPIYAQSFDPPWYVDGMGLIAQLGLGNLAHVESVVAPYVDGTRESLGGRFGVSTLVIAGHLVFAALAEETGDPRYLERARAAADLAFDENGQMLEAMPGHGEMSDAVFMGTAILAAVGHLTGERRYFDMAIRHLAFMNELVRRNDGLYRHSPLNDAAWSRGNGFAAIGYALTLSDFPTDHPAYPQLLAEYRDLMTTLARWQNEDGTWRQIVDHPGAYHETSSTAIIGFSMQRGLNRGWLGPEFEDNVARAWQGLLTRTSEDGVFIDVSESTNKQPTYNDYLLREAWFQRDARTGSFSMLFAVERAAAAAPDD
jgi:unsaturated rhamnogalacturonyl hydrolase